jgi:hypothetical protein
MDVVGKRALGELGKKMNETVGSGMSDFGRKILEKYGWKDGKGLGKNEDGRTSHVKVRGRVVSSMHDVTRVAHAPEASWPHLGQVKQREESAGLGIEEHERQVVSDQWWFNSFEHALRSFKTASGHDDAGSDKKKAKKRKRQKELESSERAAPEDGQDAYVAPSYEDLFKATGGIRLGELGATDPPCFWVWTLGPDVGRHLGLVAGMRARARQSAKWERTEKVRLQSGATTDMTTNVSMEVESTLVGVFRTLHCSSQNN